MWQQRPKPTHRPWMDGDGAPTADPHPPSLGGSCHDGPGDLLLHRLLLQPRRRHLLLEPRCRFFVDLHHARWHPSISGHGDRGSPTMMGTSVSPLSHPSCLPRRLNVSVSSLLVTAPSCGARIGGSGTREAVDLGCEIRGNSGGCVVASWICLFGAFSLSVN